MAKIPKKVKSKLPKELTETPKKHKTKKARTIKTHKTSDGLPSSKARTGRKRGTGVRGLTSTKKSRKTATATAKLRNNVMATIRRAEKRGYKFSEELKTKLKSAKYQTLQSYQRNKYKKLYGEATVTTSTGEITGLQYRQYERQKASQKAAETRRLKKQLTPTGAEAEREQPTSPKTPREREKELYHEAEIIENEEGFEEAEAQRQAEFERKKNDEQFKKSVEVGGMMWDTVRDVIHKYENLGAGRFGEYFTKLMDYYAGKYSIETIQSALSSIDMEDFLEKVDDVLYYAGNIENVIQSVQALQNFIDKAMMYSGLTPDFSWDMSLDEMAQQDFSPFSSEEYYPY